MFFACWTTIAIIDTFIMLVVLCSVFTLMLIIWAFLFYNFELFNNSINSFYIFSWAGSAVHDMIIFTFGCSLIVVLSCSVILLMYSVSSCCAVHDIFSVYGCQWIWDFEYVNFSVTASILIESDFWVGDLSVVSSVCSIVLLNGVSYKFWLSSVDVIHCFSITPFTVNSDCVPGSVMETYICSQFSGVYYGQCTELCGVLHGFMPFCIIVV